MTLTLEKKCRSLGVGVFFGGCHSGRGLAPFRTTYENLSCTDRETKALEWIVL